MAPESIQNDSRKMGRHDKKMAFGSKHGSENMAGRAEDMITKVTSHTPEEDAAAVAKRNLLKLSMRRSAFRANAMNNSASDSPIFPNVHVMLARF